MSFIKKIIYALKWRKSTGINFAQSYRIAESHFKDLDEREIPVEE